MKKLIAAACVSSFIAACVLASAEQPPAGGKGPPGDRKGPPGGMKDKGRSPRFELGRVLPPPMRDELQLSDEQLNQLDALEKEVKDRLTKILTEDQKQRLNEMGQRRPDGPPRGGPDDKGKGPPPGDDDRPRGKGKKGPPNEDRGRGEKKGPPPPPPGPDDANDGGIQWFGTLDRGLQEAQRTGRPILFLAAAPHCGGISGIW